MQLPPFPPMHLWLILTIFVYLAQSLPTSSLDNRSIANGTNLRILPLGDSITFGLLESSGNSYRRDLECLLYTGGNGVQNIGSIKNGDWADNANDGFTGQRIDEISVSGNAEIIGTPKANIVLVHAGTNDMVQNANVTGAPTRLGGLIDKITSNNPDALVLVAQIIVNGNTTINDRVKMYNQALPAIIQARSSINRSVRLVNMSAVLAGDLLPDGTHPNERGYMKMASAWYAAIVQAGKEGLIKTAAGPFINGGNSSLPTGGGNCSTLTD